MYRDRVYILIEESEGETSIIGVYATWSDAAAVIERFKEEQGKDFEDNYSIDGWVVGYEED